MTQEGESLCIPQAAPAPGRFVWLHQGFSLQSFPAGSAGEPGWGIQCPPCSHPTTGSPLSSTGWHPLRPSGDQEPLPKDVHGGPFPSHPSHGTFPQGVPRAVLGGMGDLDPTCATQATESREIEKLLHGLWVKHCWESAGGCAELTPG